MPTIPESGLPLWRDLKTDSFPALDKNLTADVTVIGAGITGITTAHLLAEEGYDVVLLEGGRLIEGTTGYTTAKITSQHGLKYNSLISTFGEEKARLFYEANEEGLNMIENTVNGLEIDCDFSKETACVYASDGKELKQVKNEAEAYKKLNIDGHFTQSVDLPFEIKGAVTMNGQAQFHPVKYLLRLVNSLSGQGVRIFEQTRVRDVTKDEQPEVVTENGHIVKSDHVVIATHYPIKDFHKGLFARLSVERSYSLAFTVSEETPEGMYLNAGSPKRSLRHARDNKGRKLLLVGGEGHKSGRHDNAFQSYENLKKWTEEHFTVEDMPYRWSSQDVETLDGMPYIGASTGKKDNIYIATGYAKWGMTQGTIAGQLITDLITGRKNRYEDLFSPFRINPGHDLKEAAKENISTGKEFAKEKLNRKETETEKLARGEGGIVQYDGKKTGAYKDQQGGLSLVKPVCTHMGCDLAWNNAEKSWDCPCHGSRFNYDGNVIEGPAVKGLDKIEKEKD